MRTFTDGKAQYGVWSKNTTAANLTDGTNEANSLYRKICALKDWPFLERTRTITTTASTQGTNLPYDCDIVREVSVSPVGQTKRYTPVLVRDVKFWDELNLTAFVSDIPQYYYVTAGQVLLWPTPASTGNTIRVAQKTRVIDLSVADVTSSTVSAIANGATALTVSGGLTTNMTGLYIRITYTGAANTGDGEWYEIAGVTNSTTATLVRAYGGATISAGTATCTIGQMPLLPEAYHDTPWRGAAATYWETNSDPRAVNFRNDYNQDTKEMGLSSSSSTTSMVIDDGQEVDILNPNLTISL